MTDTPDSKARARAFWSKVSGVPPEALIFRAPPPRWQQRLRARWPGIARVLPRSGTPPIPLNLAPWTNHRLPGISESGAGALTERLMDRLVWHLGHPDTRHEVLAWHRERRQARRRGGGRLQALRVTLRAQPKGAPPPREDDP